VEHTVEVISAEQTSQTYLTPPSPPRVEVFLRMTPIASISASSGAAPGSMGGAMAGDGSLGIMESSAGPSAVVSLPCGVVNDCLRSPALLRRRDLLVLVSMGGFVDA
jgi:hypothetical protein